VLAAEFGDSDGPVAHVAAERFGIYMPGHNIC
jgi:hypothetical protein